MLRSILGASRYVIALAVLGTFLCAMTMIVYGVFTVYTIIDDAVSHDVSVHGARALAISSIELIDLFLLGTVVYIVALGLYELFIDDQLPMPKWLQISDLDELKEKLIGVIIVLLGVSFLGTIVEWEGGHDIFYFGAAIALVITSLGIFVRVNDMERNEREHPIELIHHEPPRDG